MKSIRLVPQILELQENTSTQKELQLPVILKNKVLLSPGVWNGFNFSAEEIRSAFSRTDWNDKQNYSLIYDHDERAVNWLGWVKNTRVDESGALLGDLEVWDEDLARKLMLAGAKLGISARVLGIEDEDGFFKDFTFANFSVVYDPACKNAYINLSENKLLDKLKELEERVEQLEDGITSSSTVKGSKTGAKANEKVKNDPVKRKKEEEEKRKKKERVKMKESNSEKSNSTEMKGGKNLQKMTEDEEKETEQVQEEVSESEEKETTEESPKEEAVEESPEEEEKSEELSSKLDLVLSEIKKLSKRIAKLEESDEEPEEDKKEDKPSEDESEEEKSEELSNKKKDVKPMSNVDLSGKVPKGYTKGDAQFAEMLLSQVSLDR